MSRISLTEQWKHHGSHLWSSMSSIHLHLPRVISGALALFSRQKRDYYPFSKIRRKLRPRNLRWNTQSTPPHTPCRIYKHSLSLWIHSPSVPSGTFSAPIYQRKDMLWEIGKWNHKSEFDGKKSELWNTISLPLFVLNLRGKKEIINVTDKEVVKYRTLWICLFLHLFLSAFTSWILKFSGIFWSSVTYEEHHTQHYCVLLMN